MALDEPETQRNIFADIKTLSVQSRILRGGCIFTGKVSSIEKLVSICVWIMAIASMVALLYAGLTSYHVISLWGIRYIYLLSLILSICATLTLFIKIKILYLVSKSVSETVSEHILLCCDTKAREKMINLLQLMYEGDLDTSVLWFYEGIYGYLKIMTLILSCGLFGYLTWFFLIINAFESPFLYIFGILFLISLDKLINLISSYIKFIIRKTKRSSIGITYEH